MKNLYEFITQNIQTIVLIYVIVAIAVLIVVNIFFLKISFDIDREIKEEMRECKGCYFDTDEAKFGKWMTRVVGFIISILMAIMWWGTPILVGGLIIYDTIQEKNPELCRCETEDFDEEENK